MVLECIPLDMQLMYNTHLYIIHIYTIHTIKVPKSSKYAGRLSIINDCTLIYDYATGPGQDRLLQGYDATGQGQDRR